MIDITKLYCGSDTTGDPLRYGHRHGTAHGNPHPTEGPAHTVPPSAAARRPVVVWNTTRRCNLSCVHCYTDSHNQGYPDELTTAEGIALLDDLAAFGIPALLLSGGEPLLREDLFDLAAHARSRGLRITLSTNGTRITETVAGRIRAAGFNYVGISLDGIGETNDRFRGQKGAFEAAVRGIRHCMAVEQKVGLRLTLTKRNCRDLDRIFDFIEAEGIQRACFYHLVYAGRGSAMTEDDLTPAEARHALDLILARSLDYQRRGKQIDILTVDNHVDGVYLYLKLRQRDPERAEQVRALLEWNGGGANSSGVGFGNIDPLGEVHPDQFWQQHSFGNVRRRPFSAIWTDTRDPLMAGLKNRLPLLQGKCRTCRFQKMCGGSFRVRALAVSGNPWAPDPACYLSEAETQTGELAESE